MSVNCDRWVVFSRYSNFLHQLNRPPRYSWNMVESGVKHHNLNPNATIAWKVPLLSKDNERPVYHNIAGMIFFSQLDFNYFRLEKKKSESCRTWAEQVKNGDFTMGCRWFQLFHFLTRIIPDIERFCMVNSHSLSRVVVPAMLDSISVDTHFTRFL